jgi:TonB family protein
LAIRATRWSYTGYKDAEERTGRPPQECIRLKTMVVLENEAPAACPQPLASDCYTWAFPGSPVRIRLAIDVVERLARELTGEVEVGGILFGRAESPLQIEITDFRPIPRPDRLGAAFVLTEQDWGKIEEAKAAAASGSGGMVVVGYYRSQLREGLGLEKEDLALMRAQFHEPSNVCLLIKPPENGAGTAGFFFWDNGVIESSFSFNEFPFDAERLRMEAREQRLAALRPDPQYVDKPAEAPGQKKRSLGLVLWLMVGIVLAGSLAGGYRIFRTWRASIVSTAQPQVDNASVLALRVQTQGNDLRLSWNRASAVLRDGKVRGILTILDGDLAKQEIPLGPEELITTGHILYTPLSKSVRFRLEIQGSAQTAKESVLALKGGLPVPTAVNQPKVAATVLPGIAWPGSKSAEGAGKESPATSARRSEPARTFVLPATTNNTDEQWRQVTLDPDAPAISQTQAVSSPAPWVGALNAAPPPPAAPPQPTPTIKVETAAVPAPEIPAPTRSPEPGVISVEYTGPKPIRQIQPTLATEVRKLLFRTAEVNVKVDIDATGKVKRAEVVSATFPLVGGAATTAARLWRFEPAKRNGQNVESAMVLTFRFHAGESGAK